MNGDVPGDSRRITRRRFFAMAAAIGAGAAWAVQRPQPSNADVREARDFFPEGVASGDPDANSVLLWTRRPFSDRSKAHLSVEVADDERFSRVVASSRAALSADSDWTCRVLVGNLKPSRIYWYRFIDETGCASRTGRTITAPADNDFRMARFAFVSCQNMNMGVMHAYRRMISDDERAPESERLDFILHLGDFIYELVWYPEDWPSGTWSGRRIRDVIRYPHGEKISASSQDSTCFHIPTTLEDYRTAYRAYLRDPDLQNARARWPFVCMWDNHEFSVNGWQSIQTFNGENRPAQQRKVAANQAWFEYQPARIVKSSGPELDKFDPPTVSNETISHFDADGLGDEPNNRAALASLTAYRKLRWGPHVDLIITDQHSYRSEDPVARPETDAFSSTAFPLMVPEEALQILDAGRVYGDSAPPESIAFGDKRIANFRKNAPPQTILGAGQKQWFLQQLRHSNATWKIWANSIGTLDGRADPQNLPADSGMPWPGAGYAVTQTGDFATAWNERAQIYSVIRDAKITGFATLSGNSHSFWAGLASPWLPPRPFEPVGVAFVGGTICSPTSIEYLQDVMSSDQPLRALYLLRRPTDSTPLPMYNMLTLHGVRACLEYQRTGNMELARRQSNPELAPHLSFLDFDGSGYALIRASGEALECEFVCIPRPNERVPASTEIPVRYRVMHRVQRWRSGETPTLEQKVMEGNPAFSM
jgi:alkaline phosphatase D